MRSDPALFERLDWRGVDQSIIDKLILPNKRYGKNSPPPLYLVSTAKLRSWRKISHGDQMHIIQTKNAEITKPKSTQSRRRSKQVEPAPTAPNDLHVFSERMHVPLPSMSPERTSSAELRQTSEASITLASSSNTTSPSVNPPRAPSRLPSSWFGRSNSTHGQSKWNRPSRSINIGWNPSNQVTTHRQFPTGTMVHGFDGLQRWRLPDSDLHYTVQKLAEVSMSKA
jgi:hypothetical protein